MEDENWMIDKRDVVYFQMPNAGSCVWRKLLSNRLRNKLQILVKCIFLEQENNKGFQLC